MPYSQLCMEWIPIKKKVIIEQNHKNYHDTTITEIRQNLINISHSIKLIKVIYCPAHKGIVENETVDKLVKTAAKKCKPYSQTSLIIRNKDIVPTIFKEERKQRALNLKHTSRKGASKIIRLSFGHCILKSHISKTYLEITPDCDHWKSRKPPLVFSYNAKFSMVNDVN